MFLLLRLQNNLNVKYKYHLNVKLYKKEDTYRDLIGFIRDSRIKKVEVISQENIKVDRVIKKKLTKFNTIHLILTFVLIIRYITFTSNLFNVRFLFFF